MLCKIVRDAIVGFTEFYKTQDDIQNKPYKEFIIETNELAFVLEVFEKALLGKRDIYKILTNVHGILYYYPASNKEVNLEPI